MIHSVQKAMQILSVLSDEKNRPVPLMEIAEKTGFPKPTCSHILETLCFEGYAVRVSQAEGYILGPSTYHLTRYGRYAEDLVLLCRPVMRWMERKSHATVILSVIQSNQKFIIDYSDTEQNLFAEHPRIRIDDIYRTATGRAILAHMNREQLKAVWEKYGQPAPGHWNRVSTYDSLLDELEKIRKMDVVITEASQKDGSKIAAGYACPLFRRKVCIGAVGLAWTLPSADMQVSSETEEMLCRILLKGTSEIHRRLSYEE